MNESSVGSFTPEEAKALKKMVEMSTPMQKVEALPKNFTGTFYFTNFSDEDFTTRWNNVAYTFPAKRTSPILIATASPYEIQNIRKKFAKELAQREYYKTKEYGKLNTVPRSGIPATYVETVLEPLIQKCLEDLPVGEIHEKVLPREGEKKFRKDAKGRPITRIVDETVSLVNEARNPVE